MVALGAGVVFLRRNEAAGRAVEVWGETQVAAASAAASRFEAVGSAGAGCARIDRDSGSSLRGWLTWKGTRILLVPVGLCSVAVVVLVLDATRTAGLLGRVSRGELSPRPSQSTLRLVLDGPSLGERAGLALVSVATVLAWAAWAAVIAAPPGSGALDLAKAWVWVSGAVAVVGTGVVAGGLGLERPLRSGVREAWPLSEPEPAQKKNP